MVRNRWSPNQCVAPEQSRRGGGGGKLSGGGVRSNRHHGGINQLLAEQIRAPGSRGVLASQGPELYWGETEP